MGLVIAPFATLTGLLFYFGWVRTNAIFGYFGIDSNLLAFTPQDYLLRSVGVAFRPCAALLGLIAAGLVAFVLLRRIASQQAALIEVALAGAVFTTTGAAVLFGWTQVSQPIAAAISLIAGAVLIESAATVWSAKTFAALRRGAVAGTVTISLFWSFAIYAQQTGERVAQSIANTPSSRSTAVVFSKVDLGLAGPGVTMTKAATTAAFPYRYDGLRLYIYRDKRWFLLPVGWRRDNSATAIILPDSGDIRVELRP
ncbi:hypothetical protein [Actinoplanes sp. HUAS TT8]|uniref:hypothetical protein n=1 Tax=Actinoplanes sp. HUAS TT8 TaxID=3447453 RepID=UPI003F523E57